MADRSTEIAPVAVATDAHPVASGVKPFTYLDEFYPTISFSKSTVVTPILTAKTHVQHRNNVAVFEDPALPRVIAWAAERPNGGRSFGFTGGHYLSAFDQPQLRVTLLNALLWVAKLDVPATGAVYDGPALPRTGPPPAPAAETMLPSAKANSEVTSWGKLEWFASRALGNSTTITVGRATINPGKANPVHSHPNCDEVLHVDNGHIIARVGDREYEMSAGDTITIPEGALHNARNVGSDNAVLTLSYSTADRLTVGE
jgi:mannose-6-phosphate isomerase-like protein (cupin superfamily)